MTTRTRAGRKRKEAGGLRDNASPKHNLTLEGAAFLMFQTSNTTLAEICGHRITAKQWANHAVNFNKHSLSEERVRELLLEVGFNMIQPALYSAPKH